MRAVFFLAVASAQGDYQKYIDQYAKSYEGYMKNAGDSQNAASQNKWAEKYQQQYAHGAAAKYQKEYAGKHGDAPVELVAVNATEAKEAEKKAEELKKLGHEEDKLEHKLDKVKEAEARVEKYVPKAYQHYSVDRDEKAEKKIEAEIADVKADEAKAGKGNAANATEPLELAANVTEQVEKEEHELAKDVKKLDEKEAKLEHKLSGVEKNEANVEKYVPKAYQQYAVNASAKEEKKLKDAIERVQAKVAQAKKEEAAAKADAAKAVLAPADAPLQVPAAEFLAAKAEPAAIKAEPVEAAKAEPVEVAKAEPVEAAKAEPAKATAKNATKETTEQKMVDKYVPEPYRSNVEETMGGNTTSWRSMDKQGAQDMIDQYVPAAYRKYAMLDFHTRVHAAKAKAATKAAKTGSNTTEPVDYAGLALLSTAKAAEQSRQPMWFAPVAGCALFAVMFQAFYRPRTVSQAPLLG